MNPFKKLQNYFIIGALAKTDDVFEQVKAEVLFNFTFIFLLTNIPYLAVASKNGILLALAISTLVALALVLVILKITNNIKKATYFFLLNFILQLGGHYVLDSGNASLQGLLYFVLFILCGYLLMNRWWGFVISFGVIAIYCLGIYNINSNFSLFHTPEELADPLEVGFFKYFAVIPLILNAYLISEFVKAKQKAEKQIFEQKQILEEKQKEILDSIRYAKRIQNTLITSEKYIEKNLNNLNRN